MKLQYIILIFLIGLGIGFYLHSPDTIIENTETVKIDTLTIIDTAYVEIPYEPTPPSIPDKIERYDSGMVKSSKTWETEYQRITVTATAPCPVELFELDIENIKPLVAEIETQVITVEKLKTITIELPWYDTRTVHWIEGAAVMYLLFQGASKLK